MQGDFFIERRKKILQNRASIPTTMGLQSAPQANIGETKGSGFELSLDYNEVINKDFWITARGNFTYAKAKYVVFEEPNYFDSPWRRITGSQLGQGRGLIAERLFVDDEDVRNSPRQDFGAYTAGDIKYKDIKTRSHTDGFRRNNANYWNKREICRFYLYSSIIWFCPVLEELGK